MNAPPPKSMPYRQIFPYSPAVPHLCQPNTRWQTRARTNLDTDSGPVVFSTDVMNWKCWGGWTKTSNQSRRVTKITCCGAEWPVWPGTGTRGRRPRHLGRCGWHNLDRRGYGRREPRQRSPGYPNSGCISPVLSPLNRAPIDRGARTRVGRKRRRCFHWRRRRPSCRRGTCERRGLRSSRRALGELAGPEGAPRLLCQRRSERAGASRAEDERNNSHEITVTD